MTLGAAPQELDRQDPSLGSIQGPVEEVLDGVIVHMEGVLQAEHPFINEISFHLQQMRGKLFRPALLALANRVEDEPDDREVALGAVLEIIHLATLVHDDSIDEATVRRGLPTLNRQWSHKVSVIMGDYLYSRAMAEITRLGDLSLIELTARVTNEMTIGEMVEIAHHGKLVEDAQQYFFLIEKKTASLISTACEMGAVIGAPNHRESLKTYGHHLGMAFQLIDDMMDYQGEQAVMGKPAGSDLRERQVTYPLLAILRRLEPTERALVEEIFGSDSRPTPDRVERVISLVNERGGTEATRELAGRYADQARGALAELPPTAARDVLEAALQYVLERDR